MIGVSGSLDRSLLIALLRLGLLPEPESIMVTIAEHVSFGGGFSTELIQQTKILKKFVKLHLTILVANLVLLFNMAVSFLKPHESFFLGIFMHKPKIIAAAQKF